MLTQYPAPPTVPGRSKSLLKVKTFHDEEGIVTGHQTGSGSNSHCCGALLLETPDGRKVKVGSGMTNAQRVNPPKIGTPPPTPHPARLVCRSSVYARF